LIYKGYKAQVPLDFVIYTANDEGLTSDFVSNAITNALNTWDEATTKTLVNSVTVSTGNGAVALNNEDALLFGDYPETGVIAVASIWINRLTKQIVECDILFDTDFAWGNADDNTAVMDLQNIATHELGHAFNLADIYDSTKSYLTMYGYSYEGDIEKRTLAPGDIAGIQKLYGP
jgi:predicted Zn-dependent protease